MRYSSTLMGMGMRYSLMSMVNLGDGGKRGGGPGKGLQGKEGEGGADEREGERGQDRRDLAGLLYVTRQITG